MTKKLAYGPVLSRWLEQKNFARVARRYSLGASLEFAALIMPSVS